MTELDPTRPSLESFSGGGHPFSIPSGHDVRVPLCGFQTAKMREQKGPWVTVGAFEASGMALTTVIPDTKGGTMSYKDGMTTSSTTSDDHLSASLGLTIGYPFLKASVTGQYDKDVIESHNAVRASRNASCRLGRILLDEAPPLSIAAQTLLRNKGPEHFSKTYGDYYVAGYELGADAGATLTATTDSKESEETLVLTVKVKVLFFEETLPPIVKTSKSSSSASSMRFIGYNTLGNSKQNMQAKDLSPSGLSALQKTSTAFLRDIGALQVTARKELKRLGLRNGQPMSLSQCSDICRSGLVVQLLLAPFARLTQYVELTLGSTLALHLQLEE